MNKWKSVCFLLVCSVLVGLTNEAYASGKTVSFADVNLEAAVRDKLNKSAGDITDDDMEGLTDLDASNRGIKDISGIEYAIHLKTLILNNNQIASMDAFSKLVDLKSLWLMNNHITWLSDVSALSHLEHLYLANNQIDSLAGLEPLLQLKELNVAGNQIHELSPLTALNKLESLNVEDNKITDISGMESLGKLQWLSLAYNPVTHLSPIGELAQLQYINQRGFAVSSDSNELLKQLKNQGVIVERALVIPAGAYLYDVNQDAVSDMNDVNDMINYYLDINDMRNRHAELKVTGNEIDAAQIDGTAYIYDINRDGVFDKQDIQDLIHFYLNLNDAKSKHVEFKLIVK
ncbi:leucine-rich repeat domain-containing protein [Paenibacillus sp. HWE-109]|uniref:leucine-rich repeat domain-containing protein n=1 Tax=Paenibacillus sp. HWE-109 TaxID=1306526 RepID=UPI001EDE262A|nr:leucine-rich repeat domain-containing protein [Paenibacillus sp. HWE-109]UKS28115.1 leucine-rich repeat domain-containing protein [Paenibacillus sp. HWE-109]